MSDGVLQGHALPAKKQPTRHNETASIFSHWLKLGRHLAGFGERHRREFRVGVIMAIVVVGVRISLPWIVHQILHPWLQAMELHGGDVVLLESFSPFQVGSVLLGVLALMGYADHRERLAFARYSIGLVRDIRAQAMATLSSRTASVPRTASVSGAGELVSRLVGDTARMKAGMKGFLVHVATNGLLLIGVSIVMLVVHPGLGVIFSAAAAAIIYATAQGALATYQYALKFREKEGELAKSIERSLIKDLDHDVLFGVNDESSQHEATLSRIQGHTTWWSHGILGVAMMAALMVGYHGVADGTIDQRTFIVFLLYAFMLRAPIVQLTRQGTRTGKILACADRLEELLSADAADELVPDLAQEISLSEVSVKAGARRLRKRRAGPVNLTIPARSTLAITGPALSGKSTLLQMLTGRLRIARGSYLWDDTLIGEQHGNALCAQFCVIAGDFSWNSQRLWKLLGTSKDANDERTHTILAATGADRVIGRLRDGLNTKADSSRFSQYERRSLALAHAAFSDRAILILDDPISDRSRRKTEQALAAILEAWRGRTVIFASRRLPKGIAFDQTIQLSKGKVVDTRT